MPVDWPDEKNDAIVADQFAMLAHDITGKPSGKGQRIIVSSKPRSDARALDRVQGAGALRTTANILGTGLATGPGATGAG
ncbi:hypothetical protein LCM4577_26695 [Mesorhizobium sp. LCM 4577]|nr:hypothetical protein LCM4577_26695 [Mesorhizobium sp. LCM 4577]